MPPITDSKRNLHQQPLNQEDFIVERSFNEIKGLHFIILPKSPNAIAPKMAVSLLNCHSKTSLTSQGIKTWINLSFCSSLEGGKSTKKVQFVKKKKQIYMYIVLGDTFALLGIILRENPFVEKNMCTYLLNFNICIQILC